MGKSCTHCDKHEWNYFDDGKHNYDVKLSYKRFVVNLIVFMIKLSISKIVFWFVFGTLEHVNG